MLEAQQSARENGPAEFREIQLISLEELDEIRRLWLHEKHEFDDSLPRIFEEVTGETFTKMRDDGNALQATTGTCSERSATGTRCCLTFKSPCWASSRSFAAMTRRVGVMDALEKCLKAAVFADEAEAIEVLTERDRRLETLRAEEDDHNRQLVLFREEFVHDRERPSGRSE